MREREDSTLAWHRGVRARDRRLHNYPQTWSSNQKLTLVVSTPDGERSGSAVTKVVWQERNSVGNFPGSYKGEATVVDLGNGRYLFALLGEPTRYLALRTFGGDITEDGFAGVSDARGIRELPRKHYPLMVTFADISDPATVQRVDPGNLAASFGPGVSLNSVALKITDEPVTEDAVESALGWLESIGRERTTFIPNPPRLQKDAADPEIQYLSSDSFSTELYK